MICKICSAEKPLENFKTWKRTNGTIGILSKCNSCAFKEWKDRKSKNETCFNLPYFDEKTKTNVRVCSVCRIVKSLDNFHKLKNSTDSRCKKCKADYDKKRLENLSESERKAKFKKINDSERMKVYRKSWIASRPIELRREIQRRHDKTEHRRIKRRQYWHDKTPEQKKEFYTRRRETIRKSRMTRRAREQNCPVIIPFTKSDIIKRDGLNCYLCGKSLTEETAQIEHILPLSRGGYHKPENAKVACAFCNLSKGSKTLTEFKKFRGDYAKYQNKIYA